MHCYIVVLPADSPHAVATWHGETRTYEGTDLPDFLRRLAIERVHREKEGPQGLWRIFVCPYGDSLLNPDPAGIRDILSRLNAVGWGARIYIGISNSLSAEVLKARAACIEAFLDASEKPRCRDLFSISFEGSGSPDVGELDEFARMVESDGRYGNREKVRPGRQFLLDSLRQHLLPWACWFDGESGLTPDFRASWSMRPDSSDTGQRLVIVPPSYPTENLGLRQARFVRGLLDRFRSRPHLVASVAQSAAPADLENLCHEEELLGPFQFRHELELRHFLLRLTASSDNDHTLPSMRGLHLVRPNARGHFASSSLGLPAVLLTCSFSPREEDHCLHAAQDTAEILGALPAEIDAHIEPAVTLERLRLLLMGAGRNRRFSAWFHMGHGTGRDGLTEAGGSRQAVEDWLECFSGCALPLELAVFLTCDSHEAARAFAEAGVGITVGYHGQVDTSTARRVATAIARQMAAHGFRRRALLHGFETGARHFLAGGQDGVEPVAYASVRA